MAIRFYLPSTGFPSVSPIFSPSWEETGSAIRLNCYPNKTDSPIFNLAVAHTIAAINDVLTVQYISEPLDGYQVISGTCKGSLKVLESNAANNCRSQAVIKVVSNDGSIVRGVLLDENDGPLSNEYDATQFATRRFPLNWIAPGAVLTPVAAQDGDRIIFELGTRFHVTTTSISSTLQLGDLFVGFDCSENEAASAATTCGWMELSQTLILKRNVKVSPIYADGYRSLSDPQIDSNLANLCGTQEISTITYYIMRGTDVDCVGPSVYRTWTVMGNPDETGFYYFGVKCGPSPLADIIIVKELVI